MPFNLNFLIRIKTMDNCLYGGMRWSIGELIQKCSDALAEYRGRYELISERTVRNDIHFMRSDLFNAPIVVKKGLYFYSDPHFSIFNQRINNMVVADKIYNANRKYFTNLPLVQLSSDEQKMDFQYSFNEKDGISMLLPISTKSQKVKRKMLSSVRLEFSDNNIFRDMTWGELFEMLNKDLTKMRG
jgi:hypothetical protein